MAATVDAVVAMLASNIDRVVDPFEETVPIIVTLADGSGSVLHAGADYTPTQLAEMPSVRFPEADPGALYTLIFCDPDAPTPADPKFGEWQHWLVVNIPGSAGEPSAGHDLTAYFGPGPGKDSGVHRYAIVLYRQAHRIDETTESHLGRRSGGPARRSFKSRQFAAKHGLVPVSSLSFTCQWDERVPDLVATLQPEAPPETAK